MYHLIPLIILVVFGPVGNHRNGEIEIVDDLVEVEKIVQVQRNRLLKKGFSESEALNYSKTGLICEDQYWMWIRDPVLFPNGIPGTYNRMMWKNSGVAVMPVLPSGKIVLNLNFRHATRSWELELPRGGLLKNESEKDGAIRELKEETGLEVSHFDYLGHVASDTGMLSAVVPVYLGQVTGKEKSEQEYSEAIAGIVAFSVDELKQGLIAGYIEIEPYGKVPLRDAFLTFALLQAEIRQLIH